MRQIPSPLRGKEFRQELQHNPYCEHFQKESGILLCQTITINKKTYDLVLQLH